MPKTILRTDYKVPPYLIDTVRLEFDLDAESTAVVNTMHVIPNAESAERYAPLFLNGEDLTLVSVAVNGAPLDEGAYTATPEGLEIRRFKAPATVTIVNRFSPAANTALMGIYASGRNLISQCEAEGFRRITYFMDRPDVLTRYTTVIRASKAQYPVVLSNGNMKGEKDLGDGRREVTFVDPFPKPCYLFALVAGDLSPRKEMFTLKDGRTVELSVWVDPQDAHKSAWTLESLKKAIRWDEERWGLELDLDNFKIVATNDFNFGAMENKGLNIFNAKYALASPDTATDEDYFRIQEVVGHEYFHNWTGDRVTLRDWFQLTLKEGLTDFRDQEFSSDMLGEPSARAVQRIKDVIALRTGQFPEDAGPMAHPIRPESYEEISNFYTNTVYNKGAEVIRMLQTLLGRETFRKGLDEYIRTNDGHAVTCEAFLDAMAKASGRDLSQFKRWYSQAGTPRISVRTVWDDAKKTLALTAVQSTPPTPGQSVKRPFLIPFPVALVGADGRDLPVQLEGEAAAPAAGTRMLELADEETTFVFCGLSEKPRVSLNRGFAAPVIVDAGYDDEDLAFFASHDSDPFNRWDAMNELMIRAVRAQARAKLLGASQDVDPKLLAAAGEILKNPELSPAFKAVALTMPSERVVSDTMPLVDPAAVHAGWLAVRSAIASRHLTAFLAQADECATPGDYAPNPADAGKRALKNVCLGYGIAAGNSSATIKIRDQFNLANNLTDKLAALRLMVNSPTPAKQDMEVAAFQEWAATPLLLNKWLALQATALAFPGETPVLERVRALVGMEWFNLKNPNMVFSLVLPFLAQNPAEFHREDGSGYQFWAEMVMALNPINPQVCARVARTLENWRRYTPALAKKMHEALESVWARRDELQPTVREVIDKALHNPV